MTRTPLRHRSPRPARLLAIVAVCAAGLAATGCAPDKTQSQILTEQLESMTVPTLSQRVRGWQNWPGIEIGNTEHVIEGRHNWQSFLDASAVMRVDVYGDVISLVAVVADDHPLVQPYERLRQPEWWGVPVAGDALSVRLTPAQLDREPFEIFVQFGSDGTDPRATVTRAPRGSLGPLPQALVEVQRTRNGYEVFVRAVEIDEYGVLPFYNTAYEITATLYDFDGGADSYCALSARKLTQP